MAGLTNDCFCLVTISRNGKTVLSIPWLSLLQLFGILLAYYWPTGWRLWPNNPSIGTSDRWLFWSCNLLTDDSHCSLCTQLEETVASFLWPSPSLLLPWGGSCHSPPPSPLWGPLHHYAWQWFFLAPMDWLPFESLLSIGSISLWYIPPLIWLEGIRSVLAEAGCPSPCIPFSLGGFHPGPWSCSTVLPSSVPLHTG